MTAPLQRAPAAGRGCRFRSPAGAVLLLTTLFTGGVAMARLPEVMTDALRAGDVTGLQALLGEHDARLMRGPRGETLLHLATHYLHAENRAAMVAMLLARGFSPRAVDDGDLTPLHWAAGYGCTECLPLLLAAGAEVAARRADGGTPLHHAAMAVIDPLLAAGADPLARDRYGRMPLHTSRARHPALLAPGVDARDQYGLTALHYAALYGDQDWLEWLLHSGADPALESTAPFHFNGDEPDGSWEPRQLFPVGTRAFDMAKWGHQRTKWSSGQYRPVLERLDAVTPRRGWFSR